MAHKSQAQRQEEKAHAAQRDLQRLQQQSEKLLGASSSNDVVDDPDDSMEIWGRRIGRTLGFAFVVYLIYYLVTAIF